MTDPARDPYARVAPADEQQSMDEPQRGADERRLADPAAREVPFVDGPTGQSPLASELRGDPDLEGDRRGETGAMGGAIAGTAMAGPLGGVVGAVVGGAAGAVLEEGETTEEVDQGAADPRPAADPDPATYPRPDASSPLTETSQLDEPIERR